MASITFKPDHNSINSFIFRETEFENNEFSASNFVSKYRDVTSLETLKSQLREFSHSLKNEVFYNHIICC